MPDAPGALYDARMTPFASSPAASAFAQELGFRAALSSGLELFVSSLSPGHAAQQPLAEDK